ncbi:MAG: ABC transporter ATP-binding protein [Thermaerobacter sp.]|nr:ABC transporter ATP-binding protein [Thermaerobacter sp.]
MGKWRKSLALSLSFAWRAARWDGIVVVLLLALSAALPLLLVKLTQLLIPQLTAGHLLTAMALLVAQGAASFVSSFSGFARTAWQKVYTTKVSNYAAQTFTEHALAIGPAPMENPETYKTFIRARDTARHGRLGSLAIDLARGLVSIIQLTALVGILASISVYVSALAVILLVPSVLLQRRAGLRKFQLNQQFARTDFGSQYWSGLATRETIQDLHGNNLKGLLFQKWAETYRKQLAKTLSMEAMILRVSLGAAAWSSASMIVLLCGLVLWTGKGDLAGVIAGIQGVAVLFGSGAALGASLMQLEEGVRYVDEASPWLEVDGGVQLESTVEFIEFRHVAYRYPMQSKWVLQGISAELRQGELVAVVGSNGAGKSTLVRCLLGQLEVSDGDIVVNGTHALTTKVAWGDLAAYTPQRVVPLEVTIREYVSTGKVEAADYVPWALTKVRAGELVDCVDEPLGVVLHEGRSLSLGQWQKLSIARLLLNRTARLVVLDEPYSSMDPGSEVDLLEIYRDLALGRIAVVVTHRENVAKVADKVIFLESGQVGGVGLHSELLRQNAEYSSHWTSVGHRQSLEAGGASGY